MFASNFACVLVHRDGIRVNLHFFLQVLKFFDNHKSEALGVAAKNFAVNFDNKLGDICVSSPVDVNLLHDSHQGFIHRYL